MATVMSTKRSAMPAHFGDAGEDFAVVELDGYGQSQLVEDSVVDLHQFGFVEETIAAHYVHVALVELLVAPFLGPVGAPHGLYLVAFEWESDFVLVHHHKTRKRHREVVAQAAFGDAGREAVGVAGGQGVCVGLVEEVAVVEYFEQQLVALIAVFSGEGRQVFHGGRFNGLVAEGNEDLADGVEDIVAPVDLLRRKIACALRYAGWRHGLFFLEGQSSEVMGIFLLVFFISRLVVFSIITWFCASAPVS
jgi:hypothetical protein